MVEAKPDIPKVDLLIDFKIIPNLKSLHVRSNRNLRMRIKSPNRNNLKCLTNSKFKGN